MMRSCRSLPKNHTSCPADFKSPLKYPYPPIIQGFIVYTRMAFANLMECTQSAKMDSLVRERAHLSLADIRSEFARNSRFVYFGANV